MSKEKLLNTKVRSDHAKRLQQLLLEYHEHRLTMANHPLSDAIDYLGDWQVTRLKRTHHDLYYHPQYHEALDYLLKDLYAPKEFTRRDADMERVFPVMVKLLPDNNLYTVAALVELNLLSQRLDMELAQVHFVDMHCQEITEASYIQAYQRCDNKSARLRQMQLIANIGDDLQKYVGSRFLSFTLRVTEKAADLAGVGELHRFLSRGFHAFNAMGHVDPLLSCILLRETGILERIYNAQENPFELQGEERRSPFAIDLDR